MTTLSNQPWQVCGTVMCMQSNRWIIFDCQTKKFGIFFLLFSDTSLIRMNGSEIEPLMNGEREKIGCIGKKNVSTPKTEAYFDPNRIKCQRMNTHITKNSTDK